VTWAEALVLARRMGRMAHRKYVVLGYRSGELWLWYVTLSDGQTHRQHLYAGNRNRKRA
jgi:hypothetical protein